MNKERKIQMKPEPQNKRLDIMISEALKNKLVKRARKEGRSLSNLIKHVLTNWLNKEERK